MQGTALVGPGLCVHLNLLERNFLLPVHAFWQCSGIVWLAEGDLAAAFVGGAHATFPTHTLESRPREDHTCRVVEVCH